MLGEIASKTEHEDKEDDQEKKKNLGTAWSKPSQKHKSSELF